MQKELQIKRDFSAVGEEISHQLGAEFIKAYHEKNPNGTGSYQVGRNIIDQILAQPGCVGMRFYNALNEYGQDTLVYVGVDASGNDLIQKVVVESGGKLSTVPAIVADRSITPAGGITLPTWLWP